MCGSAQSARPGCPPGSGSGATWGLMWMGIGLLVVLVAGLSIAAAIVFILGDGNLAWGAVLGSLALGVVMLGASGFIAGAGHGFALRPLGLSLSVSSPIRAFAYAALALGGSLGFTAGYSWVVTTLDFAVLVPPDIPPGLVLPGPAALLTIAALAFWTPLTEEAFFRGFVFGGLAERFGFIPASLASAAVFSLFHADPGVLLPIFVTGLLLAWLYRQTRSLWPAVAAHAAQNGIALSATLWFQ